jgi:hypothetical protein
LVPLSNQLFKHLITAKRTNEFKQLNLPQPNSVAKVQLAPSSEPFKFHRFLPRVRNCFRSRLSTFNILNNYSHILLATLSFPPPSERNFPRERKEN